MPLMNSPRFDPVAPMTYPILNPGAGGLNLKDLEYQMGDSQSPDMVNMMYRNGAFSKRCSLEDEYHEGEAHAIHAMSSFKDMLVMHRDSDMCLYDPSSKSFSILGSAGSSKGQFIRFDGMLWYLSPEGYWQYDGTSLSQVEPYIPDVLINRTPDPDGTSEIEDTFTGDGTNKTFVLSHVRANSEGFEVKVGSTVQAESKYEFDAATSKLTFKLAPANGAVVTIKYQSFLNNYHGDTIDDYNLIGRAFRTSFHGTGKDTVYHLAQKNLAATTPLVEVDGEEVSAFTFDAVEGTVTFTDAPPEGDNNVQIVAYLGDDDFTKYQELIYRCRFHACYGGSSNSRVLLAGGGDSRIYFSDVFDASYFPEQNYITVGNSEQDVTGFGFQYNLLFVFKPKEMYSVSYYVQSASTTTDESEYGMGAFSLTLVNASRGCDCPYSIQTINNQLTWFSFADGVQTLVSTNIADERNVRPLSRNINRANRFQRGILDWTCSKDQVISFDYDQKYFLVNNKSGECFMWDYGIAPYSNTGRIEEDAARTSWFKFSGFKTECPCEALGKLYFSHEGGIGRIGDRFDDYGTQPIDAHYMTPMLQFNTARGSGSRDAVEWLKNIKNIFIQVRGDTASVIRMRYLTDEDPTGEREPEPIVVSGTLWGAFSWDSFKWRSISFGQTFRRKCSVKKVQMMGIRFYQSSNSPDEPLQRSRDMSISSIVFHYNNIKNIK